MIIPGVFGDQGARQDPTRVAGQVLEHRVLLGRKVDSRVAAPDFAAAGVDAQVRHLHHRRGDRLGPAPDRLHPRQQLLEGERLGHVVVGPDAQGLDLGLHGILRGEDQHRGGDPAVAEGAQHLHARHPGQTEIEHQDVVLAVRRQLQPLGAVVHQVYLHPLLLETSLHELADGPIVLDHQNFHASSGTPFMGRNTRNLVPRSGWDCTVRRPWCSATIP